MTEVDGEQQAGVTRGQMEREEVGHAMPRGRGSGEGGMGKAAHGVLGPPGVCLRTLAGAGGCRIDAQAFAEDLFIQARIEDRVDPDDVEIVDDGSGLQRLDEVLPWVRRGLRCGDGEVDVGCTAGGPRGAGSEDSDLTDSGRALEGWTEPCQVTLAEGGRVHRVNSMTVTGFAVPFPGATGTRHGRCGHGFGRQSPRRRRV